MKIFLSIVLTLCMIICSVSTFVVFALELDNNAIAEIIGGEELQPMATNNCANKYHHIFDNPDHNLDGFLASYGGNQAAAYGAVLSAGQTGIVAAGIVSGYQQIQVVVNGFNITVRGNVINGQFHIGTFYIP